jgi:hypothetical protein
MTDDMPDDKTLPYIEMLYKFAYGKKSYYDLAITRHVEPKETDRMRSEEEEPTDRHDRMRDVDLAMTDDALGLLGEGTQRGQRTRGRKKAHWRIPPKTRVRIQQRIRQWDGYLYNIDLFPYVERRLLAFIN